MRKFMIWSQNHPWLVIAIVLMITVLAGMKIPSVRVDASAEGMMMMGDPEQDYYAETLDKFGTDNITVIYVEDENLFSPEKMVALDDLAFALEELNGVDKVESIFTVTNFKGEDGSLSTAPLVDWLPETQEEADQIKADALRNPVLVNNVISPDGRVTAINLFVGGDPDDPEYNTTFSRAVDEQITELGGEFDRVFQLGNSYTKRLISENIMGDQIRLVPFSALVLLVTLFVMMRTPSAPILPVITAGTSVLWTMGFMGLFDIPLNILTVIVPSLIIVIGSTEDMHLLSEYMEGLEHKGLKEKALHYMASKTGTAVMLTAMTTFLGFLSITMNKIVILKQFGIVASFGLFVNPILTCMVAPVYLRLFGPKKAKEKNKKVGATDKMITSLGERIIRLIHGHKWKVFTMIFGTAVVVSLFTFNVKVDNDLLGFFKPSSDIRVRSDVLHENICGAQPFYIRINGHTDDIFKDPANLAFVYEIQQFMDQKGWFDKTISLADYMSMIHCEMNDGKEEFRKIPENPGLIPQYLLFLNRDEIERFVTPDYSEVNILVRHNMSSSYELKLALGELRDFIAKTVPPQFDVGLTGENILVNKAADSMATGQAQSLSLLLVIIFILMSFLFLNFKAGFLSLIPNIFPIMLFFGIMGIFDIALNTGTAMVAAIAIGIAVDDTIHFMTRYHKEMKQLQCQDAAMEVCIRSEIKPVFSTSVALALGFAVVCMSSFIPVINFGFLSALVMIFALLGDMFITPILLSSTQLITLWDMVALSLNADVVEKSPLFKGLKKGQVKKLVLLGEIREADAGAKAVTAGEDGSSMFLLLEGSVTVESSGQEIARLNPGDIFGEIALVNPGPRSADVIAAEQLKYIEISWQGLQNMQKRFPRLAGQVFLNLAAVLGDRLVQTDKKLIEATQS
jgi:predicted RND superfamily exporter protein